MTSVAQHFSVDQVTRIERDHASPPATRREPKQFAFVHFTAHAVANVESPLDSAVILSGPDGATKLYARDVADEPLHAELVTYRHVAVPGTCYSGEGLVGFAWAFLRAGAERVVAGLWTWDGSLHASLMTAYMRICPWASPAPRPSDVPSSPPNSYGRPLAELLLGALRAVHPPLSRQGSDD